MQRRPCGGCQPTPQPATTLDCHFVIYPDAYQGDRFLRDECYGNVWRYDQGYGYDDNDEYRQLRPRKWRRIARDE